MNNATLHALEKAMKNPKCEHMQQVAVFAWASQQTQWPELKWMYAIPNGGKRSKREAVSLVMEGVKAGVLDICLPIARHGYSGLYIEMKAQLGKTSPKQEEFMEFVLSQGFDAVVCKGYAAAIEQITQYMQEEE